MRPLLLLPRMRQRPQQNLRSGALIGQGEPGPKQDQLKSKCPRFEGNPDDLPEPV
jgi:hypothetical protein